jgi:hypothetical protein
MNPSQKSPTPYIETNEQRRLNDARETAVPWKKWGPYLSERQWGTVREDYSEGGNAWDYFSHDQAGSRTYRWGEDGLAGISTATTGRGLGRAIRPAGRGSSRGLCTCLLPPRRIR